MPHSIAKVFILFISTTTLALSQNTSVDTLSVKDGFWGLSYFNGSKEISSKEFDQILQSTSDKTIYELYSKGETQSAIAQVFAFGGGFCIGYGLTTKPTNVALAVVGGVVSIGAFFLDSAGKDNMNDAITNYNASSLTTELSLPQTPFREYTILSMAITL